MSTSTDIVHLYFGRELDINKIQLHNNNLLTEKEKVVTVTLANVTK